MNAFNVQTAAVPGLMHVLTTVSIVACA